MLELFLERKQKAVEEARRQQSLIDFTATEIRKDRNAPDGKATLDDSGDVWALVIEDAAGE
jgi:hypothetical protein